MLPFSLEAKLIAGALALAALLGGFAWFVHHERQLGAEKVTAAVQAATVKAQAEEVTKAAQVAAEQAGNLHEATVQNAARAVDARAAADIVQRLRDDSVRRAASTAAAASSIGGDPGISIRSDVVWRRLLDGAYQEADDSASDAADLANTVRGLRISGGLCAKDYRALKP